MKEKHEKNYITPGPFSINCKTCNRVLKAKEVYRCIYCDVIICEECMEHGLCIDHYQLLNDHDKHLFIKKYRSKRNYVIPAAIFWVLLMVTYIFLEFNIDFGLGIGFTITLVAIEALGGIIFLNEALTLRLVIASILILGGIIIAILAGQRKN